MPFLPEVWHASLCDGVMDRDADHALVCPCGGDRIKRHNRLRTALAAPAAAAVARSRRGCTAPTSSASARLVPQPPCRVGNPLTTTCLTGAYTGRRPMTSPLRAGCEEGRSPPAADGSRACTAYEERKRAHLQTATHCKALGIQFVPLVAEASGGGWGPTAMRTWCSLASLSRLALLPISCVNPSAWCCGGRVPGRLPVAGSHCQRRWVTVFLRILGLWAACPARLPLHLGAPQPAPASTWASQALPPS